MLTGEEGCLKTEVGSQNIQYVFQDTTSIVVIFLSEPSLRKKKKYI